jgi:LysR family glycine cleavage system transcriptional activator
MPVSPQRPKLPPLNALRAFEAAARLGGFAQAADELGVTPAAVSQHIKTLEIWAGMKLFERRSQGVRLTPAAEALAPDFRRAFDQLGQAVADLRAVAPRKTFNIAALPCIAQLWLPSRLAALRAVLGETRISVYALEQPPNLDRDLFDLSIFFRDVASPGASGPLHIVAPDRIFPACTPDVAGEIRSPGDLGRQVLLHDESWESDWPVWAGRAGWDLPDTSLHPRYSLYSLVLAEAKSGAGVMMAHEVLVQPEIDAGLLVRPLPGHAETGKALMIELRRGGVVADAIAAVLRG